MKFAIDIPHFGDCADPRTLADLAKTAEEAGWHGFFIWDHVALDWPDSVVDATVALTARGRPRLRPEIFGTSLICFPCTLTIASRAYWTTIPWSGCFP